MSVGIVPNVKASKNKAGKTAMTAINDGFWRRFNEAFQQCGLGYNEFDRHVAYENALELGEGADQAALFLDPSSGRKAPVWLYTALTNERNIGRTKVRLCAKVLKVSFDWLMGEIQGIEALDESGRYVSLYTHDDWNDAAREAIDRLRVPEEDVTRVGRVGFLPRDLPLRISGMDIYEQAKNFANRTALAVLPKPASKKN